MVCKHEAREGGEGRGFDEEATAPLRSVALLLPRRLERFFAFGCDPPNTITGRQESSQQADGRGIGRDVGESFGWKEAPQSRWNDGAKFPKEETDAPIREEVQSPDVPGPVFVAQPALEGEEAPQDL